MECRRRKNHRLMRRLPASGGWRPACLAAILQGLSLLVSTYMTEGFVTHKFLDRARIYTCLQSRRNRFLRQGVRKVVFSVNRKMVGDAPL